MDVTLQGSRAVVTGASSGIGEAIALALGAAGARVAVNYVTHPEAAEAVAARIREGGGEAVTVSADVSDAAQVSQLFARVDAAPRRWRRRRRPSASACSP